MNVYIVGNGAHGYDMRLALLDEFDLLAVWMLDDDPSRSQPWPETPGQFLVGVNDLHARRKVTERLEGDGWRAFRLGQWVHPSSSLTGVQLGQHTHVGGGVFAVRATIGDYCTIAPGVTICGDVTIGNEVFVGAGATISNLVTIGDGATVGAGATVLRDVKPGVTVVGTPAREVIR